MSKVAEFNGQGPKPTQLAIGIALVKYYVSWPYRMLTLSQADVPAPTAALNPVDAKGYPDVLISRLGVGQVRGSQLVDLTFDSADPEFAARAVNAFAEEYVAHNLSLKVESLEKSAEWLTGEVQKQALLMRQSDLGLAQYKETQDAGSLDSNQNIVVARLTSANEAATKARIDRIQKEGLWRQIQSAGDDVESITSVLNNPNIQQLRSSINLLQQERARLADRYGDRHPDYQKAVTTLANADRQLKDETRKAVQNAKSEYDSAVQQEREMQGQLNESKRQATALGRKGVDYAVLLREAESNRSIYNQLLTREKELRVVANSRTNNVRVVDRALPPAVPSSPNHRRDWAYAVALGLALGLGIAFGIDYLDDTVKTPDDITRRLKLKFLGLVPIVTGDRHPLISGPVPHDFGEAYRSIRTALAVATARYGRARGRGGELAAARRQDHDGGQHRDGARRRRRARAVDRRRHAASERAQGAAHDQRARLVAAAGRPGANARGRAAHARSESADDYRRPHARQSLRAARVRSYARIVDRVSRPDRSTGSSSTPRRCWP